MRCNNCGFENGPEVRACVKCGQPLSEQPVMGYGNNYGSQSYEDASLKQTRLQNDIMAQGAQLKKTVVQGDGWNAPEKKTQIQSICPRCNYPMNGDYCANCGYEKQIEKPQDFGKDSLINSITNKCQNCGKEVLGTFRYCPECGAKIEAKTINPFIGKKEEASIETPVHKCSLVLLNEMNGELQEGPIQEFNEDVVILNRDNTEPGNRTITSKEQAILTCEDGEWAIDNRSDYGATMVAATRKIGLQSGDIILLGNRRFRFDVKT